MKKIMNIFFKSGIKVWSLIAAIVVLLVPQLALAADKSSAIFFPIPPDDLSIALLRKIFGTVGGGLEAGSATIFGTIFYAFNSGILIVIGLFLIYTTVRSLWGMGSDAGQMSRGSITWQQTIRVAIGIGLVMPQTTGYSIINSIFMWVVLQGVGLADAMWGQAIEYMQQGGVLYTKTVTSSASPLLATGIDSNLIQKSSSDKDDNMAASDILRSQICMYSLYNVVEESRQLRLKEARQSLAVTTLYVAAQSQFLEGSTPLFHEEFDPVTHKLMFPGNADNVLPPSGESEFRNLNGVCGAYTWDNVPLPTAKSTDKNGHQSYMAAKEAGLRQMVLGLNQESSDSINLYDVDKYKNVQDFPESFNQAVYSTLVNTVAGYQAAIQTIRIFANDGYVERNLGAEQKEGGDSLYDQLMKTGWIGAGSFYIIFGKQAQKKREKAATDKSYYTPKIDASPPRCDLPLTTKKAPLCNASYGEAVNLFREYLPGGAADKYVNQLQDRLIWYKVPKNASGNVAGTTIYDDAMQFAKTLNEEFAAKATVNLPKELEDFAKSRQVRINVPTFGLFALAKYIVLDPLNGALRDVFNAWYSIFLVKTKADELEMPIIKLQHLGIDMISACFDYWRTLFARLGYVLWGYLSTALVGSAASIAAAPFSLFGVSLGVQNALKFLLDVVQLLARVIIEIPLLMFMPIVTAVTSLLLLNGVMFAYYIPLLPFLLFLFGAVSWFSAVIEGMVAAPLVALGVTHPLWTDWLPKADQALMLLLSVFVRPAAMIFGLLAGMVLSYVALELLNVGFGRIICELFYGGSCVEVGSVIGVALGGQGVAPITGLDQVKNSAMIIIYTFIVVALMQQCFSLIYLLPNYIMKWIGGPQRAAMEAKMAERVKGGFMQMVERLAGVAGGALSGMRPSGIRPVMARKLGSKEKGAGAKVAEKTGGKGGGQSGGAIEA